MQNYGFLYSLAVLTEVCSLKISILPLISNEKYGTATKISIDELLTIS